MEEKLEEMIDRHGLKAVLNALGSVCHDKADHVQSNWQDRGLASAWQRAGKACDKLAASKTVKAI